MSRATACFLILGGLAFTATCAQDSVPTVGAASSLRAVLPEIALAYERETGEVPPRLTFGASGALAKQLVAGAPLDGAILASAEAMSSLVDSGLLDPDTRFRLANNTLVLAGPRGAQDRRLSDLNGGPDAPRFAMGDPRFVPAGVHARAALEAQGAWPAARDRAIFTRDVTAALALLRRAEVELAFIYETDARRHESLEVLERVEVPLDSRPVIEGARAPGSERLAGFFTFLTSAEAQRLLKEHGFEVGAP